MHANDSTTNIRLLNSARDRLSTKGHIVLFDQFVGDQHTPLSNLIASLTAMNLFNEMGGQAYSKDEFAKICEASSLSIVQDFAVMSAPGCRVFVLSKLSKSEPQ